MQTVQRAGRGTVLVKPCMWKHPGLLWGVWILLSANSRSVSATAHPYWVYARIPDKGCDREASGHANRVTNVSRGLYPLTVANSAHDRGHTLHSYALGK